MRIYYFAYGSNMAIERLTARVPSAQLISVAELIGHALKFHKLGDKDGSGKCDAVHSGSDDDRVYGALYSILESDVPALDNIEGPGYRRKLVTVRSEDIGKVEAQTYLAIRIDPCLRPLDWYKEHVVRGAKGLGLSASYIEAIEAVACEIDTDASRRAQELAIYG